MRDPRGVLTHAEGGTVAFLPTTRRRFTQSRRNVWHSFWRLKRNCHARRAISRWITSSLMSRLTPRDRSDGKICPVRGLAAGCRFSAAGRAVGHCANPTATAEELRVYRLVAGKVKSSPIFSGSKSSRVIFKSPAPATTAKTRYQRVFRTG
jgi:hypothetical protein